MLYLLTSTNFSSVFTKIFKNLEIFLVYLVLKRAKAFTLKLAKVVVLTLHLLQDNIYKTVKLFLLNS